eukprot:3531771-Pyramimonas_sp.AAC.1
MNETVVRAAGRRGPPWKIWPERSRTLFKSSSGVTTEARRDTPCEMLKKSWVQELNKNPTFPFKS